MSYWQLGESEHVKLIQILEDDGPDCWLILLLRIRKLYNGQFWTKPAFTYRQKNYSLSEELLETYSFYNDIKYIADLWSE